MEIMISYFRILGYFFNTIQKDTVCTLLPIYIIFIYRVLLACGQFSQKISRTVFLAINRQFSLRSELQAVQENTLCSSSSHIRLSRLSQQYKETLHLQSQYPSGCISNYKFHQGSNFIFLTCLYHYKCKKTFFYMFYSHLFA